MHALETGDLSEIIDPRLEKHYVKSEMFRMIEAAAACIRHSAPKRPRMMQVKLHYYYFFQIKRYLMCSNLADYTAITTLVD